MKIARKLQGGIMMPIDEKVVERTRQRIERIKRNIKKETIMFLRKSLLSGKPHCSREEIKENLCEKIPNFDEKLLLYTKGGLFTENWLDDYLDNKTHFGVLSVLKKVNHKGNIYYRYRYKWLARITFFLSKYF